MGWHEAWDWYEGEIENEIKGESKAGGEPGTTECNTGTEDGIRIHATKEQVVMTQQQLIRLLEAMERAGRPDSTEDVRNWLEAHGYDVKNIAVNKEKANECPDKAIKERCRCDEYCGNCEGCNGCENCNDCAGCQQEEWAWLGGAWQRRRRTKRQRQGRMRRHAAIAKTLRHHQREAKQAAGCRTEEDGGEASAQLMDHRRTTSYTSNSVHEGSEYGVAGTRRTTFGSNSACGGKEYEERVATPGRATGNDGSDSATKEEDGIKSKIENRDRLEVEVGSRRSTVQPVQQTQTKTAPRLGRREAAQPAGASQEETIVRTGRAAGYRVAGHKEGEYEEKEAAAGRAAGYSDSGGKATKDEDTEAETRRATYSSNSAREGTEHEERVAASGRAAVYSNAASALESNDGITGKVRDRDRLEVEVGFRRGTAQLAQQTQTKTTPRPGRREAAQPAGAGQEETTGRGPRALADSIRPGRTTARVQEGTSRMRPAGRQANPTKSEGWDGGGNKADEREHIRGGAAGGRGREEEDFRANTPPTTKAPHKVQDTSRARRDTSTAAEDGRAGAAARGIKAVAFVTALGAMLAGCARSTGAVVGFLGLCAAMVHSGGIGAPKEAVAPSQERMSQNYNGPGATTEREDRRAEGSIKPDPTQDKAEERAEPSGAPRRCATTRGDTNCPGNRALVRCPHPYPLYISRMCLMTEERPEQITGTRSEAERHAAGIHLKQGALDLDSYGGLTNALKEKVRVQIISDLGDRPKLKSSPAPQPSGGRPNQTKVSPDSHQLPLMLGRPEVSPRSRATPSGANPGPDHRAPGPVRCPPPSPLYTPRMCLTAEKRPEQIASARGEAEQCTDLSGPSHPCHEPKHADGSDLEQGAINLDSYGNLTYALEEKGPVQIASDHRDRPKFKSSPAPQPSGGRPDQLKVSPDTPQLLLTPGRPEVPSRSRATSGGATPAPDHRAPGPVRCPPSSPLCTPRMCLTAEETPEQIAGARSEAEQNADLPGPSYLHHEPGHADGTYHEQGAIHPTGDTNRRATELQPNIPDTYGKATGKIGIQVMAQHGSKMRRRAPRHLRPAAQTGTEEADTPEPAGGNQAIELQPNITDSAGPHGDRKDTGTEARAGGKGYSGTEEPANNPPPSGGERPRETRDATSRSPTTTATPEPGNCGRPPELQRRAVTPALHPDYRDQEGSRRPDISRTGRIQSQSEGSSEPRRTKKAMGDESKATPRVTGTTPEEEEAATMATTAATTTTTVTTTATTTTRHGRTPETIESAAQHGQPRHGPVHPEPEGLQGDGHNAQEGGAGARALFRRRSQYQEGEEESVSLETGTRRPPPAPPTSGGATRRRTPPPPPDGGESPSHHTAPSQAGPPPPYGGDSPSHHTGPSQAGPPPPTPDTQAHEIQNPEAGPRQAPATATPGGRLPNLTEHWSRTRGWVTLIVSHRRSMAASVAVAAVLVVVIVTAMWSDRLHEALKACMRALNRRKTDEWHHTPWATTPRTTQ
jgi:hypothetical protein